MQFITTGNRIAVENFTVGYLYTITFTNGDYIHTACTGIGIDFVMFTRVQPDYMFALTMDTAVTVSTIDIYSGGGSTMNYNDLTNKPQINNVELVGNKTLNDLGIQPVITDDNKLSYTLISGLGTAATTATSDYATAAQGALADTAVQPTALNDYQTLIDNDNKLSADLVDDTSTTNKFATSAQLDQIETNKNNISVLTANGGGKNYLKVSFDSSISQQGLTFAKNADESVSVSGRFTGGSYAPDIATCTLPAGSYWLTGCPSGGGSSSWRLDILSPYIADEGNGAQFTLTQSSTVTVRCRIATNDNIDLLFKPMISAIGGDYQPYAMSNVELTPTTQSIQHNFSAANTLEKTSLSYTVGIGTYLISCSISWDSGEPLALMLSSGADVASVTRYTTYAGVVVESGQGQTLQTISALVNVTQTPMTLNVFAKNASATGRSRITLSAQKLS